MRSLDPISIYATPMRSQRRKSTLRHRNSLEHENDAQRINIVISSPNRYHRSTNRAAHGVQSTYTEKWKDVTATSNSPQRRVVNKDQQEVHISDHSSRSRYNNSDRTNELYCQLSDSSIESNSGHSARESDLLPDNRSQHELMSQGKKVRRSIRDLDGPSKVEGATRYDQRANQSNKARTPQGSRYELRSPSSKLIDDDHEHHELVVRGCQNCAGASRKSGSPSETSTKTVSSLSGMRDGFDQTSNKSKQMLATTTPDLKVSNAREMLNQSSVSTSQPESKQQCSPNTQR